AIMTEQYIKSSDIALLYSEMDSHSAYNELAEDIFLNYTFNEDDFTMI
ncbi:2753_t:CDS:1, partial [Rhizophagus irregularis]